MLYMAVFPERKGHSLNQKFFEEQKNKLAQLLPDEASWSHIVRVLDVGKKGKGKTLHVNANCINQRVVCYLR
jgi:hypothetical protein